MADMRFVESDHHAAKLRKAEPLRHLTAQHPTLRFRSHGAALAGDDKNDTHPVGLRVKQEIQQHAMGFGLRHAMQVEPRIDILASTRQL